MANSSSSSSTWYFLLLMGIILLSLYPDYSDALLNRNIDPEIQRRIDDYIENDYLPASQISGLVLAIVQNDGEVLYTTGYGLADIERGIPNENSTHFLIASVTKSMTALLAAKLLHEQFPDLGEAVLDTPIRKLVPQANFTLIDRFRSEHATFRDLLAHRMCLSNAEIDLLADPFNSTEDSIYRARYTPEICGMRGDFQYSNRMYNMAGELAGLLAGKSYEDAMEDLFDEIGMPTAKFLNKTDDYSQMPHRAKPYYIRDNMTHPFNTKLLGRGDSLASGDLFVSLDEMATYLRLQLNKGNIGGRQIIPQEVIEWLTKPSISIPDFFDNEPDEKFIWKRFAYGLGFMLVSYDGWPAIFHGGYVAPYRSLLTMYPAKKLGIFTTSNMGPVLVDQRVLHTFIFELFTSEGNGEDPKAKAMMVRDEIRYRMELGKSESKEKVQTFYQEMLEKAVLQGVAQNTMVGKYGSGDMGDAEVTERFNEQTNKTEYYFEYGIWYKGWLQEIEGSGGTIFRLAFDTDVVQDDYADGGDADDKFIGFDNNGTLTLFTTIGGDDVIVFATFKLGVSLDILPPIPWNQDSCGPELMK